MCRACHAKERQMDQTLVRSGFDAEIALSERYLTYLLLVALDAGLIPATFEVDNSDGAITATLQIPPDVDRTYPLDPEAVAAEETQGDGFTVAILFNDPSTADIRVTAKAHLTRASPFLDINGTFQLFAKLGLQKTPQANGPGLDSAGLSIEL